MTRCVRISAAYIFRLARKHSTLCLITFLVLTITSILHLYVYKKEDVRHTAKRTDDFEYRPGLFLKGKQPNESFSYCYFNYGLPDEFDWDDVKLFTSPEEGKHGNNRVIFNVIQGTTYATYSKFDSVTYVTHATPEFIYHIVEIARYWDGPISLAVFVPSYDLYLTMQIINHLCHCHVGMAKISLHLIYPKNYPPIVKIPKRKAPEKVSAVSTVSNLSKEEMLKMKLNKYRSLNNKTRADYIQRVRKQKIERMMKHIPSMYSKEGTLHFKDCSGPENFGQLAVLPTFRRVKNLKYPINVARNVARIATTSNYFIVSDIELVPSDNLATKFLAMIRKIMGDKKRNAGRVFVKTVFVVPLFEVERGETIPRDKDTLVKMVSENRAKYFHQKICNHCQRFPGIQTWLTRRSSSLMTEPMIIARREYPYHRWEPIYFGTQNEPWYSETLTWEGRQDKMAQMLEMCLQNYHMVVLDGGFLCHAASSKFNPHSKEEGRNRKKFQVIAAYLQRKYPDRPKCKAKWGYMNLNDFEKSSKSPRY